VREGRHLLNPFEEPPYDSVRTKRNTINFWTLSEHFEQSEKRWVVNGPASVHDAGPLHLLPLDKDSVAGHAQRAQASGLSSVALVFGVMLI
jgi:hypothetical protein